MNLFATWVTVSDLVAGGTFNSHRMFHLVVPRVRQPICSYSNRRSCTANGGVPARGQNLSTYAGCAQRNLYLTSSAGGDLAEPCQGSASHWHVSTWLR